MTIGQRLKLIRKHLYLTQAEFAKNLKLKQATIGMYENGTRNVGDRSIFQICDRFNVNEEWLRYGTGEMFLESDKITLDEYARQNNLSEEELKIMKLYMSVDKDVRKKLMEEIKSIFLPKESTKEHLTLVARGGIQRITLNAQQKEKLAKAALADSLTNQNDDTDLF